MAVDLQQDAGGKILVIKLTGKLTKEDYEHFVPKVESLIKDHGKLRILVQMHNFQGWAGGALWQDIKFDLKNFRHIERVALVGEKSWEHGMAAFCKPFTTATMRYFDRSEVEQAEVWIRADLIVPQGAGSATAVGEQKG
jgi:hypothetical protein